MQPCGQKHAGPALLFVLLVRLFTFFLFVLLKQLVLVFKFTCWSFYLFF